MIDRKLWVYDLETLASCFTYTAKNVDTKQVVQFVIHKERDEREALFDHLMNDCAWHIGFNSLSFDYPIIHFFLTEGFYSYGTAEELITLLYNKAQQVISAQNGEDRWALMIKPKDEIIRQLDLYKVWHYDNKSRITSLKALEISMNYPNVQDMPIDHKRTDIRKDEIEEILDYNLNDVLATEVFFDNSKEKLSLRKSLTAEFGIPCINYPDPKIGESLILKLYCDKTNSNPWETKKLRTYRHIINLKECILPWIKFETKVFQELLEKFKSKTIKETKGAVEESVIYKGFKYDYGLGGIHGCIESGIYEDSKEYIIIDADVGSLYPNLAITNGFYPEHLGKEFIEVYKLIIDMRMEAKKAKNMTLSDGLKLAANSAYGKSNEIYSFLYDPKFTMSITLNGQLLLTLLAERLVNMIPNIIVLGVNTDGITVKFHRKHVELYNFICHEWEQETKLNLEYVEYSKMWIGDVNNYGALSTTGKIKNKGRFEVDKFVGNEPAYHKDNSFRIVPLALQEFFTKGIPIEDTITNHRNIYDFCGRQKFNQYSHGETNQIDYDKFGNPYNRIEKQQKNTRYYISNSGITFVKRYTKGTTEIINKGYQVEIFNKFIDKSWEEYKINYKFYIRECKKELYSINPIQFKMFE